MMWRCPWRAASISQNAKIGRAVMDADVFISLTHFKGHETTGFGGAIKNIGMGCGSRAGKMEQHTDGKPVIDPPRNCRGLPAAARKECANDGLVFNETTRKIGSRHRTTAWAAAAVIGACNFDAIAFGNDSATEELNCKMAEYTKAVRGRPPQLPHFAW